MPYVYQNMLKKKSPRLRRRGIAVETGCWLSGRKGLIVKTLLLLS